MEDVKVPTTGSRPAFEGWMPQPGNWVRLRSGGPAMLVEWADYGRVVCRMGKQSYDLSVESVEPADLLIA